MFSTSYLCNAQKDSTDITGTWVELISKDKNRFMFAADGYVVSVIAGDTVGGSPARNPRTRIYLRYEVGKNKIHGFYIIDLIKGRQPSDKEIEMSRLKGIFIYLNDGRMKLCVNSNPAEPRPAEFVRENTFILTKQE